MKRLSSAILVCVCVGLLFLTGGCRKPFPPDSTPEGAYLRIAKNIGDGHPAEIFAYLETEAQWASYTIRDVRAKACALIRTDYPESARGDLMARYQEEGDAPDGAAAFIAIAQRHNWIARLRRDLSGIARVETEGERATVITVRGTRYSFRRRDNGIWGLTLFTADLLAEEQRASRDLAVVEMAAQDYAKAKERSP